MRPLELRPIGGVAWGRQRRPPPPRRGLVNGCV